jgi:hypothetical protein
VVSYFNDIASVTINSRPGFLKLEENDIVFVRASAAPASGEEDVAVCWVTGE